LNETINEKLVEGNETYYEQLEADKRQFDQSYERVSEALNRKIEKLAELEGLVNSLENRTLSEIADDATTAYINSRYTFKTVTVFDANTGLPITGATVNVYDSYYNAFYYPTETTFGESTNESGSTAQLQLDNEKEYYVIVSAPGYASKTASSGYVEDSYSLQTTAPVIRIVNSWTVGQDIDTYVSSTSGRGLYRDRDIMNAPGGETFTFTPESDSNGNPERFLVFANAYGYGISPSGASVQFFKDDVLVNTVSVPSDA